jgi:tetratricopeptide (TPR) repeat protein
MSHEGQSRDGCLDPQVLAAFAERKLKRSEIPAVLAHLDRCPRCVSTLEAAMALMEPRKASRPWLAIAAAVTIVVGAGTFVRRTLISTPGERLVRMAPRSARVVEPRLSGGFGWAPYRGPMRSTGGDSEAQRMKLVGAAGELVERADADQSADAQHAAGIGLVLVDRPEDAIARLRVAAERSPADARPWSDLAAAEYMAALRLGRFSLYPVALAHADRALRLDPKLAEALFNRALILERLGLTKAAREAWSRSLSVDPSSKWAEEARERLKRLPETTGESQFKREQPGLENAAARKDQPAVDAFVDRHRQQSRTWAEAEYLGRWAEAGQRGDHESASRQLAIARAIGEALVRGSGESLLHDAVAVIDGASSAGRATLAEAHASYRRGRIAYSRGDLAPAETDLRRAAELFAASGGPMALVARYYAASARFDRGDVPTARRELEELLDEANARPRYHALGAQVRWELGLCAILDEDWSATAALISDAGQAFRELGEKSNLAFMQTTLATALIHLGRPDEGWALRVKAFELQSGEGRGDRLPISIGDAARVEMRMGRLDSARALLGLEESAHRAVADDVLYSNALVREAVIGASAGDETGASVSAREAMTIARRVRDPELRTRAIADAAFAAGAVALSKDPRQAHELLSQAIEYYAATDKSFYLPEARLLRARASLRAGRNGDAFRDLEAGVEELDRHPTAVAGTVTGTGVLDARRALFDELIPLRLDRGETAEAFSDSERGRRRLSWGAESKASTVRALQEKLAGSGVALLELTVLPRELVAFCVTEGGFAVTRRAMPIESVIALASRNDDGAMRELYDLLVRPAETSLPRARELIVVADAPLEQIPFAALFDARTKRRLVETMPVAMALSAASLQPGGTRRRAAIRRSDGVAGGRGHRNGCPAGGSGGACRHRAALRQVDRDRRRGGDSAGVLGSGVARRRHPPRRTHGAPDRSRRRGAAVPRAWRGRRAGNVEPDCGPEAGAADRHSGRLRDAACPACLGDARIESRRRFSGGGSHGRHRDAHSGCRQRGA